MPHAGIGHARRMQVDVPAQPARGHDRGGREPHARGRRHRRDRHRGRGACGAHHRRTRRAAHRYRARHRPREHPHEPDAVRLGRRHRRRDAVGRGSQASRHAQDRARAQSLADVRCRHRDPGSQPLGASTRRSPKSSTPCCAVTSRGPKMRVRNDKGGVEVVQEAETQTVQSRYAPRLARPLEDSRRAGSALGRCRRGRTNPPPTSCASSRMA